MRASEGRLGTLSYGPGILEGPVCEELCLLTDGSDHSMTRKSDVLANPGLRLQIDRKVLSSKPSWSTWQDPVSANEPNVFKSRHKNLLTKQAPLRLVVGGQPEALPFFTSPVYLVCSETGSQSSPGCLESGDLLTSASQVPGLKVCTTTSNTFLLFINQSLHW